MQEYTPSQYQLDIFNFVQHGHGNAIIEAVPGAGKTYTLIQCLKFIPTNMKVLVVAFNTDIVQELRGKIESLDTKPEIDCRTMHSLGLSMLTCNHRVNTEPCEYKYNNYIREYLSSYEDETYKAMSKSDKSIFAETIKKYIDFGRYYLCRTVKDMEKIGNEYSFSCMGKEKEIALELLERGRQDLGCIDFTDMVYLPIVLNCKPYRHLYDWILVDEAQDLEKEERVLIERCFKKNTRMLCFGEGNQSIYSFKGTDSKSFAEFSKFPNTIKLPLSITYRCSKAVVRFLNRFNPNVKASGNAIEGSVKWHCDLSEVKDGDMILCRVNAPLMEVYSKLSARGVTAYIKGKDIGNNLITLLESTKETELNRRLDKKGAFSYLYNQLFDLIDDVMRRNKISFEMAIESMDVSQLYDKILALEAIGGDMITTQDLINRLNNLFSDEKKSGVSLSTIHKAKGLEAENVYICCPSLLPSKSAKLPWEIEEEQHLEYVAYSRPKNKLGFLNEDDMSRYSRTSQQKASDLQAMKMRIFYLYGGEMRCSGVTINEETSKVIIEHATEINPTSCNIKTIDTINNNKPTSSFASFKLKKSKRR